MPTDTPSADFAKRLSFDELPISQQNELIELVKRSREQLERPTLDAEEFCQELAFETMKAIFDKLSLPATCWATVEQALADVCKSFGDRIRPHLRPSTDRQLREENERLRKALGMSDDDKLISSSPDGTFIREDRVGNRTRVNLMAEEYRELVQLRQENERLRAATEWKPIAEALKDGTEYQGGWFGMSGCYYSGTPICWQRTDGREGWFLLSPTGEQANKDWYPCPWLKQIDYPTHFRPLPAPPTEAEKGSERK